MSDTSKWRQFYLGIGITELDGDISFQFILKANGMYAGYGFHDRRLPVRYMADGANVNRSLSADNFRR